MTPGDCERVGEIRVRGWQWAYRGLVARSYLDGLDPAEDVERRRTMLAEAAPGVVNLVSADAAGTVTGWVCHGPYREGDTTTADAEVYALYVDPERAGTGIGRALLETSLSHCAAAGYPRALLWVLKGNTRARRFYTSAGFHADGTEEPFEVNGTAVPEVRYRRELTG
ncbi:GNAT family N-acetyltransferase [Streptomyces sp. RG38]|uniref:GNAT family N-acetyltransferase n=2 Tax=Streptomyces tagetis TaxID=2820809 RepID=A0A940XFC1_9ACTN|nr:GNAT family N-acetyltransferase [Streptomyces sp. RG38]MBQ0825591.1 GNAT family N-acetyltransferase [Streptomyces sp. RG38]